MSNKENTSINKLEGPMLKMEPLQMKKKKKGGGYNLRKSIAWNRAFFTEEGVLDAEELSLISGTAVSSSGEGISTINEEVMDSLVEDDPFITGSPNLQALEKNLFKGTSSSSSSLGKEETSYLPLKHTSPASFSKNSMSMSSRKVSSTRLAKRAGSISGASPPPLPSPSLKRPANIYTRKPVFEESKLPKVPVSKPRHQSLLASSKSTIRGTASSMKNQIPCSVLNKQRNVEPKSYTKGVNIPKSKAKSGSESLPLKSSSLNAKRNKINPPSSMPASTQLSSSQVNKVGNSGPKVIEENVPGTAEGHLSEEKDITASLAVSSLSNNVAADGALQHSKVQLSKPSGLRMPSPSLGFFDQSKVSASQRFSRRVVDTNPRVEKLSDKRPPVKVPQVSHSNVAIANSSVSCSTYDVKVLPNTSIAPQLEGDAGKKGQDSFNEHEHGGLDSDEHMIMCVVSNEEKHQVKNEASVVPEKDRGVERIDCKIPLVTESCKHLVEEVVANDSNIGVKTYPELTGSKSSQVLSQRNFTPCAADVTGNRSSTKSLHKEENSSNFAVSELDVAIESQTCEMNNSEVLSNDIETSTGKKHGVLDACDSPTLDDENMENKIGFSGSYASEVFGSKSFSYGFELEDSVMEDDITENSYMPETPAQAPNLVSLIANMSENSVDQPSETEDLSIPSCKLLELQTACLKVEHLSRNIPGSPSVECKLILKHGDSEENQKSISETSLLVLSEKSSKNESDDSCTLMSDALHRFEGEGSHTEKITRLVYSELDSDQAVVNQEHLPLRSVSSVACFSDEPSSLAIPSCSSEVLEMTDSESFTLLETTCQDSFDGSYLENQLADMSQASLSLESKVCNEIQRCDRQTAAESDPDLHACTLIELERQSSLSEVANVLEKDGLQMDSVDTGNCSNTGDDSELFTGGCEPDSTISHASDVWDQISEGTDCAVEFDKPESPNTMSLSGHCLIKERDEGAYSIDSGLHVLPDEQDPCESEIGSSKAISITTLTPLPAQGDAHDVDESIEGPSIDELRSSYTETQPSFEKNKLCSGSPLKNEAQYGGLFQEDLTLPEGKNQFGSTACAFGDEAHADVSQKRDSLVGNPKCDVVTFSQEKDEKAAAEIDKGKLLKTPTEKNITVIPRRNAVPFSDEWLAAIEAAGEEILTMKGGAVQNSPPDKSLPEPSPWSPVKKKNNGIGPYDCTKYTNI